MKRFLLAAALGGFSLAACGQSPSAAPKPAAAPQAKASATDASAEAGVRAALRKLNPNIAVDYVGPAPLPGFREVVAGGQVVFVSDDGKYLVQGSVLDMATRRDLSQGSDALGKYRAALLSQVPKSERIVFAPPNPKYTLSVFTDITCGYCRRMHSQIADYNRQGIAIEYLAWPRTGPDSPDADDMAAVWCAGDRQKALTDAKNDRPVASRSCKNPVASEYELGQKLGVSGTPAVFTAGGDQIGGYLPPAQLRALLDSMSAKGSL